MVERVKHMEACMDAVQAALRKGMLRRHRDTIIRKLSSESDIFP